MVDNRNGMEGCGKYRHHRHFVYPCTLFVLYPLLVLCRDCPAFCHLSLLTTHTHTTHTHTHIHTLTKLTHTHTTHIHTLTHTHSHTHTHTHIHTLTLTQLTLTHTHTLTQLTHTLTLTHTQLSHTHSHSHTHTTRNPSRWSAADYRLIPLGHWDRLGFDPRTFQPVASRYTDRAIAVLLQYTSLWPPPPPPPPPSVRGSSHFCSCLQSTQDVATLPSSFPWQQTTQIRRTNCFGARCCVKSQPSK